MKMKILSEIQAQLKAPKGQYNNFGKYKYRSCEDIVEAVKPILAEYSAVLLLSDEIVQIGDRYYVRACAQIVGDDWHVETVAFAREPDEKKGMDSSQITGTASSYARKYALNGLLAIDDTKDADTDEHQQQTQGAAQKRVNKEVMQQSMARILECLDAEDGLGMREVTEELEQHEIEWVWQHFSTKQKSAIKALLHSVKQ